jgi:curli production assembly/transport component CsgE
MAGVAEVVCSEARARAARRNSAAFRSAALGVLSCLAVATACAVEAVAPSPTRRIAPEEIDGGAVVDQTVTVVGHDFFSHFALAWSEQPLSERYTLSIHERPSARWGSEIWVEYAQRRVFHAFLRPSRADLKRVGEQAAQAAYSRVVDTEVQRLLFREADLGWDEF